MLLSVTRRHRMQNEWNVHVLFLGTRISALTVLSLEVLRDVHGAGVKSAKLPSPSHQD